MLSVVQQTITYFNKHYAHTMNAAFKERLEQLEKEHNALIIQKEQKGTNPATAFLTVMNIPCLRVHHAPLFWKYDLNPETNPFLHGTVWHTCCL